MRRGLFSLKHCKKSLAWLTTLIVLAILLSLPATALAQNISYTFSGVIRVLDLSSPPPGSGPPVPGVDPLGMDGAAILLTCVIDSATAPSFTGPNNDGAYAFYNAGQATLAITGSVGGAVDGTYTDTPCSIRVDDHPVGSPYGGDVLGITTKWNLGMPFPDVFQVPFAQLGDGTFTGIGLQTFLASEVVDFIGVNFSGSNDVFYFDSGTGIAMGAILMVSPAQRIEALIDAVEAHPDLKKGQKLSLIVKLEKALRFLGQGKVKPAMRVLGAFINRVRALIHSGKLTLEDGQALIDEAGEVIEQIRTG